MNKYDMGYKALHPDPINWVKEIKALVWALGWIFLGWLLTSALSVL